LPLLHLLLLLDVTLLQLFGLPLVLLLYLLSLRRGGIALYQALVLLLLPLLQFLTFLILLRVQLFLLLLIALIVTRISGVGR